MKKLLLLLMLIPLLVFSQGKKISEYPKIATPNDSDIVLVNKWTGVNTFATKTMYYIDLKNAINSGDTSYLPTTGVAYQHDSLYIDKLLCGEEMELITENGLSIKETTNNRTLLTLTDGGDFSISNTTQGYNPYHLYKNDTVFRLSTFNQAFTGTFFESKYDGSQYNYNTQQGFSTYVLNKNGDFIYSTSPTDTAISVTNGKIYLPKAQDKDNNLDSVLVYEPLTGQFKVRDASSLGGGVDTTALKTTGKTYQHDSLYVDKLFVQSTGAINSNVYTVPTTSTTNGVNWSGLGVSIKSPASTLLGFYSGANQTFTVASAFVSVAGNLFAAAGNTYNIGTSANPFKDLYIGTVSLKTTPNVSTGDSVLVRRQSTGLIEMRLASTLTPSLTTNYIGFGSGSNKVTGSSDFTWNNAAKELYANGSGYFGGVNGVARMNITTSNNGGASKGLSIYNSLNSEVFYINDIGQVQGNNIKTIQNNLSLGDNAGLNQVANSYVVHIGTDAGKLVTDGANIVNIGAYSGAKLTGTNAGNNMVNVGAYAGYNGITTVESVNVGYNAGLNETVGYNVNIGRGAGQRITSAYESVNIGYNTQGSQTGHQNTNVGAYSGLSLTSGTQNALYGTGSGGALTSGGYNTYLGWRAGYSGTTASENVFIGYEAGYNETGNKKLYIGNSRTSTLIYGEFDNKIVQINNILRIEPQSATTASAITPSDGMVIYVNTTDATFTSVGIWARENGVWVKL